jgi:hypothetical protein
MVEIKEVELYFPIKKCLESLGFLVQAEINHVDVIAKKGTDLVLVELKTNLNVHVIAQAIDRQSLTDFVYIGIKKPPLSTLKGKTHQDKIKILKKLSIGLMYVNCNTQTAEIVFDPTVRPHIKKAKKRIKLLNAFLELKHNPNIGGSYHQKMMTVYKKQAMLIGYYLIDGPKKVVEIRKITHIEKTQSILYKNYYGWFESRFRGVYELTEAGYKALKDYKPDE